MRPVYSRTLCLPCLRQVFCASNTTAIEATMSSESFLPISDDVCRPRKRFDALFSKSPPKKLLGFSWQLTWATAPHRPNGADLEVCWCCFSTLTSNRHTGPHRAEFLFWLQKKFTPPPKGGGAGSCSTIGSSDFQYREARCFSAGKDGYFVPDGFPRQLPLATAAHNQLTRLRQDPFGASLVSVPLPGSQNHTQGRTEPGLVSSHFIYSK